MYLKAATAGPYAENTLDATNTVINDYGFKDSWRFIDNAAHDMAMASDPDNSKNYLWSTLPSLFILETATMKIVKASQIDGFSLNALTEVTALNK